MIKSIIKASAISLSVIGASIAQADGIVGQILFTSFDWEKDGTTVSVENPMVAIAEGDFAVDAASTVIYNDLDYSPFSAPAGPLWITDNFEFFISGLSIISETETGLELEGSGIVSDRNGILDDTRAIWSFSGGTLNWSSATRVSAPANLALLGFGLCALTIVRRQASAVS